jgi:CRP-like cAMP-binding protein
MDIAELKTLHLFASLDDEQLGRVVASSREIEYDKGARLFDQGDPASSFFLVREGMVKLFLLSRAGEEKVVELIRPGHLFAEAVMFMEGARYPVNAQALAPTGVIAFSNAVFLGLLQESPPLALRMLGDMSRRLHGLLREIDELTLFDATDRFCAYLVHEMRGADDSGRIVLAATKHTIASRLSIKPETLSRILAQLRDEHILRVEGDTLVLLDEDALRRRLAP